MYSVLRQLRGFVLQFQHFIKAQLCLDNTKGLMRNKLAHENDFLNDYVTQCYFAAMLLKMGPSWVNKK